MERNLECLERIIDKLTDRNEDLESEKLAVLAENDALTAENEKLRLEAQCHAQEARTQRATVQDIYQVVSGATGEPVDWHGAEPVRKAFEALHKEIAEQAKQLSSMRCA